MPFIDEDRLYGNIEEKYKFAQGEARKAYSDVLDTICEMPRAYVEEVRHGYWAKVSEPMPIYICSICLNRNLFKDGNNVLSNFCPHCGAKMDE